MDLHKFQCPVTAIIYRQKSEDFEHKSSIKTHSAQWKVNPSSESLMVIARFPTVPFSLPKLINISSRLDSETIMLVSRKIVGSKSGDWVNRRSRCLLCDITFKN